MELKKALKLFGLKEKEQEVYLLLCKHSWITALELSRHSPIKRTTLYRILESLTKKGLIEVQIGDKTTHYNAADAKQFESLVLEQEKKAKTMRSRLGDIQSHLDLISQTKPHDTSVRFYKGKRGLKHMEWKMADNKSKKIYIFGSKLQWEKNLGTDFAEKIREEQVNNNIKVFEIHTKGFLDPIQPNGTTSWTNNTQFVLNHYQHRAISPKKLTIPQYIYLFDNIIHLSGYRENEIIGIEIVSEDYSSLLTQLFTFVWNQAEVIDKFGGKDL